MNTITYMRLNSFTAEQYRIDVIKFFTCSKINIARMGRESITWRNDVLPKIVVHKYTSDSLIQTGSTFPVKRKIWKFNKKIEYKNYFI